MTDTHQETAANGAIINVPLNRLKKSPRNARRTAHDPAAIEALAASIAAKTMLQAPVVEPELDGEGRETGCYFVTIGEGRRLAQLLRVKRKEIKKTELIRCVVDLEHDPHEISLDENVTRSDMHPADQFEAFKRLADERGFGPEEIGARFGVSAQVVRQRLRLGAVSPKLMQLYRDGELTLDQLMAFTVTDDQERQEQVCDALAWNRTPYLIRRKLTELHAPANDRRAIFVGLDAYVEAGGVAARDLFTEDGGGWLEDVALLDRLACEKLTGIAEQLRHKEGWKWAEAAIHFPASAHDFSRIRPQVVELSPDVKARGDALSAEYDGMMSEWDGAEEVPEPVEVRFREIDQELQALDETRRQFAPEDIARAGLIVCLDHHGHVCVERGFVRSEDEIIPEPSPGALADTVPDPVSSVLGGRRPEANDERDEGAKSLSDRVILDLTAHRTAAIRDCLAQQPQLALVAVTHALTLATFYPPYDQPTCLDIRPNSVRLGGYAERIEECRASQAIAVRHEAWASRLPQNVGDAWLAIMGLTEAELYELLAHCVSLTVSAVHVPFETRLQKRAHADVLADALSLDMTEYWTATAESYFGHVTKVQIVQAVTEAVSNEAAARLGNLKKQAMAEAAEMLVAGQGWLPQPLRRTRPSETEESAQAA